ncbi:MAG: YfhO family protein, partial [Candidatus Hydrogenedentota bacterium]
GQTAFAKKAGGMAAALGVAGIVAAAQWLPAISWIVESGRGVESVWNARAAAQLPGTGQDLLTQILSASPGALPRIGYVGTLPLLLSPVALFHRRGGKDAWFFLFAGLVLTGLAFMAPWGETSYHFPWWVAAYPIVLCVAVLTALGADRLIPAGPHTHLSSLIPPVVIVALMLGGLFVVAGAQIRGYLIAFGVLTAPALFVRRGWMARGVWLCWMVLLFADLTAASVNAYVHPFQDGGARRGRLYEVADLVGDYVGDDRVFVAAEPNDVRLPRNIGLLTDLRVVNGTGPGYRREHEPWWRDVLDQEVEREDEEGLLPGKRLLRYAGARVILVGQDVSLNEEGWTQALPGLRVVGGDALTTVLVDDEALPWATWYTAWEVEPDLEDAIRRMRDPAFPIGGRCILESEPDFSEAEPRGIVPEDYGNALGTGTEGGPRIEIVQREPEEIRINVEAASPGVLVLADQYHPGWRAEANGESVPIVRANGIFRGVCLEAGTHELRLAYAPPALEGGLWISITGLGLLVIAGWIGVARDSI